jgi:peptidoglycan L-alanyl-D-glutamate endopeptidase CwlK
MTDQYKFSNRSLDKLGTVHQDLQMLFKEAIRHSPHDFSITEGKRSLERQKELVAAKKSRTMNSRHLSGKAVDIAVFIENNVSWNFSLYQDVANHIKAMSILLGVSIVWGGDWETFRDGVHYELDRKVYG